MRPETVWSRRVAAPISDPNVPILERMLHVISQPIRLRDPGGPGGGAGSGTGAART
jgi:hypothetical protein